jgi:hypothetical protein
MKPKETIELVNYLVHSKNIIDNTRIILNLTEFQFQFLIECWYYIGERGWNTMFSRFEIAEIHDKLTGVKWAYHRDQNQNMKVLHELGYLTFAMNKMAQGGNFIVYYRLDKDKFDHFIATMYVYWLKELKEFPKLVPFDPSDDAIRNARQDIADLDNRVKKLIAPYTGRGPRKTTT